MQIFKTVSYLIRNNITQCNHRKNLIARKGLSTIVRQEKLFNVTFYGSDLFSLIILRSLNDLLKSKKIANLNVITCESEREKSNKKKDGLLLQNNRVIQFCKDNGIDYYLWTQIKVNSPDKNALICKDLAFVASFGYLIPSKIINLHKLYVLSFHIASG
jgi:methionyl-tRNA formyltransferase